MATCDPIWHQHFLRGSDVVWFKLAARLRDKQGTYIYQIGPPPTSRSAARCGATTASP